MNGCRLGNRHFSRSSRGVQEEKETLKKAIAYLEEKCQVYRDTILDNELVVKDEATGSWQRGYVDPRYMVMFTKSIQTELTSEALSTNESQFLSLHDKLKVVTTLQSTSDTSTV